MSARPAPASSCAADADEHAVRATNATAIEAVRRIAPSRLSDPRAAPLRRKGDQPREGVRFMNPKYGLAALAATALLAAGCGSSSDDKTAKPAAAADSSMTMSHESMSHKS